jgi:hypothetical protein
VTLIRVVIPINAQDWSNGREWWSAQSPMSCEETLLSQAEATHAANPETHVMVYRNSVKLVFARATNLIRAPQELRHVERRADLDAHPKTR